MTATAATSDAPDATTAQAWCIDHVDLRIELSAERVLIDCSSHARWVGQSSGRVPLVLDGRGLETLGVAVDGVTLDSDAYELTDRVLTIDLDGDAHVVSTRVAVRPRGPGDPGIAHRSGLISTNCEPQGFRRITWSIDRPGNRSTFDVTLVSDPTEFRTLLSNGDRVDGGVLADSRTWERFVDPITKPTYLFAFVAGDLDLVSAQHVTPSGRQIELRIAAARAQIGGTAFALRAMATAMAFDEANGGIEHDLDTLTFVAVPGYPDATEYHGLMFFESSLLVTDLRGFTDDDLLLSLANIAHEYGHHVRGNRVTVSSWGQLGLKEGLTVLMGQNDVRRHLFGPVARVLDVVDLRRLQFPEEVTIGAPVERGAVANPEQIYTRTTYLKSAEIFGMLRTLLGPDDWRRVFAAFVARHDLGAAGIHDFVTIAQTEVPARAGDIEAVARWFQLAGRPALSWVVDSGDSGDGSTAIDVRRTDALTDDPSVGMPLVIGFRHLDGTPAVVSIDGSAQAVEHTVVFTGRERRFAVQGAGPVVVSPLRGYSAPVDLATDLPSDHLSTLVVHDDDAVARWWASEELAIRAIDAHRAGDAATAQAEIDRLAMALRPVLHTDIEPMLLGQLLSMPDEFMLGDRDAQIDVDGVASGLAAVRHGLGRALHDPLLDVLERHGDDDPDGTSPADIAKRSLVESCLALLLTTGSPDGFAAAEGQLRATNPTRSVRALAQLAHIEGVHFEEYVHETYERWQGAPKLLDRWLRAQSGSRRTDTIERVAALVTGPLYDRYDRGRVMGVWFPFATRNRNAFHHPSGAGYRMFIDEVIELMPINAGVVFRLVGDLLQFKRFDEHRSALMRVELQRLADAPGMPDFAVDRVRALLA